MAVDAQSIRWTLHGDDVEERRLCPPSLVSVYDGESWIAEQMLGWRLRFGTCRCLVRPAQSLGGTEAPARWVDARAVRPRRDAVLEVHSAPSSGPGCRTLRSTGPRVLPRPAF